MGFIFFIFESIIFLTYWACRKQGVRTLCFSFPGLIEPERSGLLAQSTLKFICSPFQAVNRGRALQLNVVAKCKVIAPFKWGECLFSFVTWCKVLTISCQYVLTCSDFFFYFDTHSTEVPERCQKLFTKKYNSNVCLNPLSFAISISFFCAWSVFFTGFGSLLRCRNLPDFVIILAYPSVLILQLVLLVSEFLVSRYLASNFFVIWCCQRCNIYENNCWGKDTVQYDTTEKYQMSNRMFWTVS